MEQQITLNDLIKIDETVYEIPMSYRTDMRVPARVFSNEQLLKDILNDRSLWQLANVATLPGIVQHAWAMPDIHQGYGFPIGGVAGMDIANGGVISPGGIGYDINCGVRLIACEMTHKEVQPYLEKLATEISRSIPSGVGRGGKLELSIPELDNVLEQGAHYMVNQGYGTELDLEFCEENGRMVGAQPYLVSERAKNRGSDQLGTLGSGNHFLEIQYVDEIFDQQVANVFGLAKDQVTIMIHCGSRGLGHQTCTDYVRRMMTKLDEWAIQLPDKELVCAPFNSPEAQDYFGAMQAAANFAWANRHLIGHRVRQSWEKVIGKQLLRLVYDVSHNIGKKEKHTIDGIERNLIMHRKGATRAFGPGRPEIPIAYRHVGQPVLIPGTMGTASYVLVGTAEGMNVALGSSCHGAGRRMSRMKAKNEVRGSQLRKELEAAGIIIRSDSNQGLAEEAPVAYKDVEEVVDVVQASRLARKVVRLKPLAVIKGE